MIDVKQMKKDLQRVSKILRKQSSTWCQCCMSAKQVINNSCTLNFYKKKTDEEMKDIILSDPIDDFRRKYAELTATIETNSRNQSMIRFSW